MPPNPPAAAVARILAQIDEHADDLRADAVHSDLTGRTSATIAAFLDRSGCLRITGEERSGGLGEGAGTVVRIAHRLARHHPSAAWNVVVSTSHLASAQSFEGNPFVSATDGPTPSLCGSYGSRDAEARHTAGGHLVTGTWGPAPNAQHASWATIDAAHEEWGRVIMIVPTADLTVHETWRSLGLRGTASHTLAADALFVPEGRLMPAERFFLDAPPGSPLAMRQPKLLRTSTGLAAVALGAAQAFRDLVARRGGFSPQTFGTADGLSPHGVFAHALGEAGTRLDSAEGLLRVSADRLDEVARNGGSLSPTDTVHIRARLGRVVRDIADAVHELAFLAGSDRSAEGTEIGRLWRDVHAALSHGALAPAPGFIRLGDLDLTTA